MSGFTRTRYERNEIYIIFFSCTINVQLLVVEGTTVIRVEMRDFRNNIFKVFIPRAWRNL